MTLIAFFFMCGVSVRSVSHSKGSATDLFLNSNEVEAEVKDLRRHKAVSFDY